MEPLAPMKPMKPMEPMEPMEPMKAVDHWWPADMGEASTTGGAGGVRYAYFARQHRLIVERHGRRTTYDTADHHIQGVMQSSSSAEGLSFSSQHGRVDLGDLTTV
jgi:hypothetical protein